MNIDAVVLGCAEVGDRVEAAGGFDAFLRDTCVIVTSDHGHSEILADADEAVIRLDRTLEHFRQAELGRPWQDRDEILICPNMRAAQIYVRQPSPVLIDRLARTALLDARVDTVMWRRDVTDSHGAGYSVFTQRGHLAFWRGTDGAMHGVDAYGTVWSWKGDLEALQYELDGDRLESSEYPNAFERIAGVLDARNSGEIWMTARPGCEFEVPGGKAHVGGGSHGALHALDSLSPVIVANAPRRLPRAMRSIDIASLCMEALGLPPRYAVSASR